MTGTVGGVMLSMSSNLHPAVARPPVALVQAMEQDPLPPSQQPT
jgi:hypothetical protein